MNSTVLDYVFGMIRGNQKIDIASLIEFVASMGNLTWSAKGIASKIITSCFYSEVISVEMLLQGNHSLNEIQSALKELEEIQLITYPEMGIISLKQEIRDQL